MALGGLVSCEVVQNYTYRVTNSADDEISVHVVGFGVDTLMTIPVNETRTVFVKTHYSTITEKTKHNVALDLEHFTVEKGGLRSRRDYLRNDSWQYDREGVYTAVVTDSDFPAVE